ncbi:MAG: serine hydrolase [Fimbriimonadaceae bacterium]
MVSLCVALVSSLHTDSLAGSAVYSALTEFRDAGARVGNIAITVGVIDKKSRDIDFSSYRGDVVTYPASIVKLFYVCHLADALSRGRLKMTPELERAAHDMIVDSNNDATGLVLDTITGTTGGPELSGNALADWENQRRTVNRFFEANGYAAVNACQKTWNEGPYGRERAFLGPNFENRNQLSTVACANLMAEVAGVTDLKVKALKEVSKSRLEWLRFLLNRKTTGEGDLDSQTRGFSGEALRSGSKLYSKAGWSGNTRHDVAWVILPDGTEMVWAIMTTGTDNAKNAKIIPWIARQNHSLDCPISDWSR